VFLLTILVLNSYWTFSNVQEFPGMNTLTHWYSRGPAKKHEKHSLSFQRAMNSAATSLTLTSGNISAWNSWKKTPKPQTRVFKKDQDFLFWKMHDQFKLSLPIRILITYLTILGSCLAKRKIKKMMKSLIFCLIIYFRKNIEIALIKIPLTICNGA